MKIIHCILPLFPLFFPALLSDTLRTYTKSGCDLEPITLSCPRGTSISIEIAQYMPTSIENECVSSTVTTIAGNIIQDGVVNAGTEIEIKAPEKCSWTGVLNVSFHLSFQFFISPAVRLIKFNQKCIAQLFFLSLSRLLPSTCRYNFLMSN